MLARHENKILRWHERPADFENLSKYIVIGGDVSIVGDYKIHTFTTDSQLKVYTFPLDVSALAVGGGSGAVNAVVGIASYTGGGGGGALVENYNLRLEPSIYEIKVGAGGVKGNGTTDCRYGSSGGDSGIIGVLEASGAYSNYGTVAPSPTTGISSASGFGGGVGGSNAGGGGGGDSSTGKNGIANFRGGDGGIGTLSKITGQYYGGGGEGVCNITVGNPGLGVIGRGSKGNTTTSNNTGQNGIVIIKYKYK